MSQSATTPVALDGLRLRDDFEDKEPRIRDLELAKRLGYAKPYDIRRLIIRMHEDGKLPGISQFVTVANRADGLPSKPSKEFWLDERACLKVIAKSDTANADAILDQIIDVFMAYRRGKLLPRLLADAPCEWDPMWTTKVVSALCHLYGQPYSGRFPSFLASVIQRIYKLVLEPATYIDMKVRNPDPKWGSNHHQWLTEQARERFRKELVVIEGTALSSNSREEFWSRLERVYLGEDCSVIVTGERAHVAPWSSLADYREVDDLLGLAEVARIALATKRARMEVVHG